MRACEATKRWASSASAISRENSATGLPCSTAAFSAMLQTSALLPIAGRAAMMIRLPGWKPPVISSRSLKPDGVPVSEVPSSESRCSLSSSSCSTSSIARKSCWRSSRADLEHRLLGLLDELARARLVAEHALLDLVGGLQQPPQQRVLAHDLRVAAGVAGRRHDARQLVHGRLPADVIELAHLAQPVGDRQHVDRLALVVERQHRLVDRAVALAVEVLRAQPLFDHERVQRAVREQDRAEHRLLGVEVVRRARSPRRATFGAPLAVETALMAMSSAESRSASPARRQPLPANLGRIGPRTHVRRAPLRAQPASAPAARRIDEPCVAAR